MNQYPFGLISLVPLPQRPLLLDGDVDDSCPVGSDDDTAAAVVHNATGPPIVSCDRVADLFAVLVVRLGIELFTLQVCSFGDSG